MNDDPVIVNEVFLGKEEIESFINGFSNVMAGLDLPFGAKTLALVMLWHIWQSRVGGGVNLEQYIDNTKQLWSTIDMLVEGKSDEDLPGGM